MPALSQPPNRSPVTGEQRISTPWQQWFTALYRSVAPSDVFYIPAASGVPTTVPETRAGFVAMKYDTASNNLYVYNGAWVKVTLA